MFSATVIITLHMHKAPHSWLAYIFVHTPMRLFLAMLFFIDWLDNGFMYAYFIAAWPVSPRHSSLSDLPFFLQRSWVGEP